MIDCFQDLHPLVIYTKPARFAPFTILYLQFQSIVMQYHLVIASKQGAGAELSHLRQCQIGTVRVLEDVSGRKHCTMNGGRSYSRRGLFSKRPKLQDCS